MANGFVEEYVAYASEFCDAPNAYHYFCGLGTLAAVVSRKCSLPFGVKDLHPNLWLLLVGTSGERKTSAISIADYLLSRSSAAPVFPNEFSREALMETFQKHGHGVFIISEYSNLMGVMRRSYNDGVMGFLTDIYDVPRIYRRETLNKGTVELTKPCPNMLAGTTPEYMRTSADEWFSGWGPRFLVIPGERKRLIALPGTPDRVREERLLSYLSNAKRCPTQNFYLPEEERAWFVAWAGEFDKSMREGHARTKALGARLYAYSLKVAMLLQVSARADWLDVRVPMANEFGGNESRITSETVPLRLPYLQRASEVVMALAKSTTEVLWKSSINRDPFAEKRTRLLEAIRSCERVKEPAFHSKLSKMLEMSPKDLRDTLSSLQDSDEIERVHMKTKHGRDGLAYIIKGQAPAPQPQKQQEHHHGNEANGTGSEAA